MASKLWLPQTERIVLVDVFPEWRPSGWSVHATGTGYKVHKVTLPQWRIYVRDFTDVKYNGTSLTETSAIPTAIDQWYYDPDSTTLYVSVSDTVDPNNEDEFIVATLKIVFASSQYDLNGTIYPEILVDTDKFVISKSINTLWSRSTSMSLDDVTIACAHDRSGLTRDMMNECEFTNARIDITVAGKGLSASDAKQIYKGFITDIELQSDSFMLRISDIRAKYLKKFETKALSRTYYPEAEVRGGEPLFVLYGQVNDAQRICLSKHAAYVKSFVSANDPNQNRYVYYKRTFTFQYTIQNGDHLEYLVAWKQSGAKIAVDLKFTDGTYLRNLSISDDKGYGSHPNITIPDSRIVNAVYHRRFDLTGVVGKTISELLIACEQDTTGTYEAVISWIVITDGAGTVRKTLYGEAVQGEYHDTADYFIFDSSNDYDSSINDAPATWSFNVGARRLEAAGGSQALLIKKGAKFQDGLVVARATKASDAGIVFRVQDSQNYYLVKFADDTSIPTGNNIVLYKRVNGAFTQITGADVNWTRGNEAEIIVLVQGSTIKVWFDNGSGRNLVINTTDTDITADGGVGLRHNGTGSDHFTMFAVNTGWSESLISHERHSITIQRASLWLVAEHELGSSSSIVHPSTGQSLPDVWDVTESGIVVAPIPEIGSLMIVAYGRKRGTTYMKKPGEILVDILTKYAGMPFDEIDTSALYGLDINTFPAGRPFELGIQVKGGTDITSVIRKIEESVGAYLVVDGNGKVTVRSYVPKETGNELWLNSDQLILTRATRLRPYRILNLKYAWRHKSGKAVEIIIDSRRARYAANAEMNFGTLDTYLNSTTDAETMGHYYTAMLERGLWEIEADGGPELFDLIPGDKIFVTNNEFPESPVRLWITETEYRPVEGVARIRAIIEDDTILTESKNHHDLQSCGVCEATCEQACQTSCQSSCEVCQTTCETGTCQTTCQQTCQGCQVTCQTTCEQACETTCESSGCQTVCQTSGCQTSCEVSGGCQTTCEASCQGCLSACMDVCESSCQSNCQQNCLTTCEQTGCESSCMYVCKSACETAPEGPTGG